ncbi:MAG: tRNA (N(6)-L-threonylcarbamoyladenosine(37)-C(2))-methylthiotransferase MtaB, partial [Bacteroidales bacterium]|nr:tRNA (N(6)-L-threonylcarbamoyladenosine(37)-C(2))-methylthiotransferase MtaB [Bacteroidales bacterium]
MSVRVAIKTLGCKLNFSESATLERRLAEEGYENVPFSDDADVYVVNTCAVTEEAGRKCRY